jgi:hypothetical protein
MAALWADNPDYYNLAALPRVWTSLTGSGTFTGIGENAVTIETGTGRRAGTNSIRCDNVGGVPAGWTYFVLQKTLVAGSPTLICAFGIQFISFTPVAAEIPFWAVGDASDWHVGLAMRNDHTLVFTRGPQPGQLGSVGTTIATTVNPLTTGVWYHFSIKVTIDDAAGALSFRINRVEQLGGGLGLTGIDTRNASSAAWSRFGFWAAKPASGAGTAQNPSYRISDVVVCDSTGAANNDHPGDCAVLVQLPNVGNGGNIDWAPSAGTDHGALVDEATPNDDTDYNQGTAPGQRDTYIYPALPVTIGTPRFVVHRPCMKLTAAGSTNVLDVVRKAGVNYDGAVPLAPTSGSYAYYDFVREVDPATGVPWTIAGINAAESGVKVQ